MRNELGRFIKGPRDFESSGMLGKHHSRKTKDVMSLIRKCSETGYKKGHVPWITGKKHSIKAKEKMSAASKGHIAWNKDTNIQTNTGRTHFKKGFTPWNKGKKDCYKLSDETKKKIGLKSKGQHHSYMTKKKLSRMKIAYYDKIGRVSTEMALIRVSKRYKRWRKRVFERDNYTCLICGNVGGELNAHHIKPFAKYPELRYEVSNGATLCNRCHFLNSKFDPGKLR